MKSFLHEEFENISDEKFLPWFSNRLNKSSLRLYSYFRETLCWGMNTLVTTWMAGFSVQSGGKLYDPIDNHWIAESSVQVYDHIR